MTIPQHIMHSTWFALLALTCVALADPPNEAHAGLWLVDHTNPDAGWMVRVGDDPSMPPDVQADLEAFNQSLAQSPVYLRNGWLETSRDGRAFGLGNTSPSQEPHGVWIWPNWREASPIIFEQHNYFFFVSNRHVHLFHHGGEVDTSAVADIHDPETLYTLPGVVARTLQLTDDGRWASVPVGPGGNVVLIGQLNPQQPNAGAAAAQTVELPAQGRIQYLAWVHGGDFLVVGMNPHDHDEDAPWMLFVVRTADMTVVDSLEHAWLFAGGFTAGDTGFYGGFEGQRAFHTISPDGSISTQLTGFPNEGEGRERPASISPSGMITVTYWNDMELEEVEGEDHFLMSEVLRTEDRHTPVLGDPEQPLPTWPTHEMDGEEVDASIYLWLSWE